MKRSFRALMTVAILMAALLYLAPTDAQAGDYKPVTDKELQELLSDGQDIKIIDVRDADSFRSGHIEGAKNVPYNLGVRRLMRRLAFTDRIVFVCYGGPTGDGFAQTLADNNFKDVYSLIGGMNEWRGRVVR